MTPEKVAEAIREGEAALSRFECLAGLHKGKPAASTAVGRQSCAEMADARRRWIRRLREIVPTAANPPGGLPSGA